MIASYYFYQAYRWWFNHPSEYDSGQNGSFLQFFEGEKKHFIDLKPPKGVRLPSHLPYVTKPAKQRDRETVNLVDDPPCSDLKQQVVSVLEEQNQENVEQRCEPPGGNPQPSFLRVFSMGFGGPKVVTWLNHLFEKYADARHKGS